MRITRFPSLTTTQFSGCIAAFVDSLAGELNAAGAALRRLEGTSKGAAFAYEMTLDRHRYGALIVLDRWSAVVEAFGAHVELPRSEGIIQHAASRVADAQQILARANDLIDSAETYRTDVVEACLMAWRSLNVTFEEERREADESSKLGPMLAEDYREARRILLEDLAAR